MNTKFWFVTYTLTSMSASKINHTNPTNVILVGIHPLVWAANPPEVSKLVKQVTTVLFFTEITEDIMQQVKAANWTSIEDHLR